MNWNILVRRYTKLKVLKQAKRNKPNKYFRKLKYLYQRKKKLCGRINEVRREKTALVISMTITLSAVVTIQIMPWSKQIL